jgi:hypothetical protein
MRQSTTQVLVNHTQAEMYRVNIEETSSNLAGCSQEAALKMLEILELTQLKLALLLAIEEQIQFSEFDNEL